MRYTTVSVSCSSCSNRARVESGLLRPLGLSLTTLHLRMHHTGGASCTETNSDRLVAHHLQTACIWIRFWSRNYTRTDYERMSSWIRSD